MKEIPLTQGKAALVDDEDYEFLNQWKWYAKRGTNTYYAARSSGTPSQHNQKTIRMHRVILNPQKYLEIDHIDGNGLNNCRSNLREVTRRGNQQNQHVSKSSNYPGVTLIKTTGLWQAQAKIRGRNAYLGHYRVERDAAEAYMNAVKEFS